MQNRSTFNVGSAVCACPAVRTGGVCRLCSSCGCCACGRAAGSGDAQCSSRHSRRWQSGDCAAGLPAPQRRGWDGNWEPLSQLPPFLTVLSTQRCVVFPGASWPSESFHLWLLDSGLWAAPALWCHVFVMFLCWLSY